MQDPSPRLSTAVQAAETRREWRLRTRALMSSCVTQGFDEALDLIAIKIAGAEKAEMPNVDRAHDLARLNEINVLREYTSSESRLPDRAPNRETCNAWLVDVRRARS